MPAPKRRATTRRATTRRVKRVPNCKPWAKVEDDWTFEHAAAADIVAAIQQRKGEKFLSARATLRGKSLKIRGRAIQVDLRSKPAGNYNVHIVAEYRTKSGKVHIVRSTRNLSVTVA
jgi:hypothetical protein